MSAHHLIDRIPTITNPLEQHYLKPLSDFVQQWIDNFCFYQDFVYACPFNNSLVQHFIEQTKICPLPTAWSLIFSYFAATYSALELADLLYETFHDLDQHYFYLDFLTHNHYRYMWPSGKHFCDPFLEIPPLSYA